MNARLPLLLPLLLALPCFAASAQTFPVDDSASQVLESGPLKMRWDSVIPKPGQPSTMTGQVVVLVRLDVAQWRGRRGRIYQRLAPVPNGPVTAAWSANGPLMPGRVRDGERALVFSGAIASERIEDTFRLTIQADGNRVLRPQDLHFSFEFEPESP
jgi:hypothetical protein